MLMFVGPRVHLGQILSSSLGALGLSVYFILPCYLDYFMSRSNWASSPSLTFECCCRDFRVFSFISLIMFYVLTLILVSVQSLLFQRSRLLFFKINAKLGGLNSMISTEQMFSNDHRVSSQFNIKKSNTSSSFKLFCLSSFIESLVIFL